MLSQILRSFEILQHKLEKFCSVEWAVVSMSPSGFLTFRLGLVVVMFFEYNNFVDAVYR